MVTEMAGPTLKFTLKVMTNSATYCLSKIVTSHNPYQGFLINMHVCMHRWLPPPPQAKSVINAELMMFVQSFIH